MERRERFARTLKFGSKRRECNIFRLLFFFPIIVIWNIWKCHEMQKQSKLIYDLCTSLSLYWKLEFSSTKLIFLYCYRMDWFGGRKTANFVPKLFMGLKIWWEIDRNDLLTMNKMCIQLMVSHISITSNRTKWTKWAHHFTANVKWNVDLNGWNHRVKWQAIKWLLYYGKIELLDRKIQFILENLNLLARADVRIEHHEQSSNVAYYFNWRCEPMFGGLRLSLWLYSLINWYIALHNCLVW